MKYYNTIKTLLLLVLLTAGASCANDDFTFSSHRCMVIIDNSKHLNPILNSVCNPYVGGTYCAISVNAGGTGYDLETNLGEKSSDYRFNDIDKKTTRILGMNNGIIIGYGHDGTFYAYDRECPSCFDPEAIPVKSRRLSMRHDGIAHCTMCKNEYNMNYGGNCLTGKGHLERYRTLPPQVNGIIQVSN